MFVGKFLSQLLHLICIFLLQTFTSALMLRLQILPESVQPCLVTALDCSPVRIAFLLHSTTQAATVH